MSLFTGMKRVLKTRPAKIVLILAAAGVLTFVGFTAWDIYAPVSVHDRNGTELARIKPADPANFTFAVFGDNKGNRSVFEPLLRDISGRTEISFAIDVGDLVNGGERRQFRHLLSQLQDNLTVPFLAVPGNHDHADLGNYQEVFGPTYYSFQIGRAYFIALDATTEAGFSKEELIWLEDELQKSQASAARFVFMHVPPFDPRGVPFHHCLPEKDGNELLALFSRYNVTHLFASHIHGYFTGVRQGVPYTITGGAGASLQGHDREHFFYHYVEVRLRDGKVDTTVRRIQEE